MLEVVQLADVRFRNKILLWGFVVICIVTFSSYAGTEITSNIIINASLELAGLIFLGYWFLSKKRNPKTFAWLGSTYIASVALMMTFVLPDFSNYLILYLLAVVGAFYKRLPLYIYSASLGLVLLVYMVLTQEKVMNISSEVQSLSYDWLGVILNTVIYYLIVVIALFFLVFSDRLFNRNFLEVFNKSEELKQDLTEHDDLVSKEVLNLEKSVSTLSEVSNTNTIAFNELTQSFREFGATTMHQSETINGLYSSVSESTERIVALLKSVAYIQTKTNLSTRESAQGNQLINSVVGELERLFKKFSGVHSEFLKVVDSMELLQDTNEQIRGLASTTNILALNASIEASRAGQDGKGFGVIAVEVRNLAGQTDQLAQDVGVKVEEISSEIKSLNEELNNSLEILNGLKSVATETSSSFSRINDSVQDVEQSTNDMVLSLEVVEKGITSVDEALQNFSSVLEENTATVEQVVATIDNLNITNHKVNEGVQSVKSTIIRLNKVREGNDNA